LANPEVLCKLGQISADKKCNEISYDKNMTKDKSANLVSCSYTNSQKCNYTNTDNTTLQLDCGCAYNDVGSSWCPASPVGGK